MEDSVAVTSQRTRDLVARDLRAVWHPFTQHATWPADDPLVIERAEGVHLWDTDGRRYLDGVSSLWVTVHGHREPAIDAAVRAQLDRLDHSTFLGLTHEPGVELAEELLRIAPAGLTRVFFAGDGSSAAERAAEVVDELGGLLARERGRVCAVVVEPMVQAAGGILTHDAAFLRGVRALCDEHGAAMVADEVATGIGATGRWWAVEHAGVAPDLLVTGKRVTGGYLPLSAVLATEAVYEAFLGTPSSRRTFFHGHTYTANPLCCAAGVANLRLMHERSTVDRAAAVGERIGALLAPLEECGGVAEVRRIGTMTGIEVRAVRERTGFAVCRAARDRGVIVRPLGDVVVLMPPLGIGDDDLAELAGTVSDCVRGVVG